MTHNGFVTILVVLLMSAALSITVANRLQDHLVGIKEITSAECEEHRDEHTP